MLWLQVCVLEMLGFDWWIDVYDDVNVSYRRGCIASMCLVFIVLLVQWVSRTFTLILLYWSVYRTFNVPSHCASNTCWSSPSPSFLGCNIVSVTSPSASTLKVVWGSYSGATNYVLDFRVVNSTSIAPVVVMQGPESTQRLIQGLRPGHVYQITLKVFDYFTLVCTDAQVSITGKDMFFWLLFFK